MSQAKGIGKEIAGRIGNRGDLVRAAELFNLPIQEVKKMLAVDVLEMIALHNVLQY